jgi:hypothetical protein
VGDLVGVTRHVVEKAQLRGPKWDPHEVAKRPERYVRCPRGRRVIPLAQHGPEYPFRAFEADGLAAKNPATSSALTPMQRSATVGGRAQALDDRKCH